MSNFIEKIFHFTFQAMALTVCIAFWIVVPTVLLYLISRALQLLGVIA